MLRRRRRLGSYSRNEVKRVMAYKTELWQDIKGLAGLPLYGVIFVISGVLKQYALAVELVIALGLCFLVTIIVRAFYFQERPMKQEFKSGLEKLDAASFPSLHSMRGAVLATLLGMFFSNVMLGVLFALCALAIACARVAQKRHFARDVVAGLVLGLLIALASVEIVHLIGL